TARGRARNGPRGDRLRSSANEGLGRGRGTGIRGLPCDCAGSRRAAATSVAGSARSLSKEMKYYLTTPIYYTNAAPHLGHTYTTIAADAIKRLKTMQGFDVVLTTGTDEHGQKIERAATATGKSPQEFTDLIADEFRRQWATLG